MRLVPGAGRTRGRVAGVPAVMAEPLATRPRAAGLPAGLAIACATERPSGGRRCVVSIFGMTRSDQRLREQGDPLEVRGLQVCCCQFVPTALGMRGVRALGVSATTPGEEPETGASRQAFMQLSCVCTKGGGLTL